MKVFFYKFKNIDRSNNTLLRTIEEMVTETDISNKTVIKTLKVLEECNIIKRKAGIIFVYPTVLFRGGTNNLYVIFITYHQNKKF